MDKKDEKQSCPIKLETLVEKWNIMKTHYSTETQKMRLLEGAANGDFWKVLDVKYPPYQVLPDTNYISYIKNNIAASLYTVMKSASLLATSDEDKDIVKQLNIILERVWSLSKVGTFQFKAGNNAALFNKGYTQVGWDKDKDQPTLKNISPLRFMRDPFATSLESAGYCCHFERLHESQYLTNANYKENFENYKRNNRGVANTQEFPENRGGMNIPSSTDKYYTLTIYWVREGAALYEVHVVDNSSILYWKSIKPAVFPIAELTCDESGNRLIGSSPCGKIFANYAAHNIANSVLLTAELRNQRPPKFISTQSGLDPVAFAKHGDQADKTFVVQTNPRDAVYYHQFPVVSPQLANAMFSLTKGIELVSGVDGRYTGRDTGSITTTGGTQDMLDRVTIIDTPKIVNYEEYTAKLTELIIRNLIMYAPKRKYLIKSKTKPGVWDTIEVDFPEIDDETVFDYEIMISSDLPKNKQRLADMANMLMEKQMQYRQDGENVDLISAEEWLEMQDLPAAERMLERMGIQRLNNAVEDAAQVLTQYTALVEQGMDPQEALLASANTLSQRRAGMPPSPEIPGEEMPMMGGGMPMQAGGMM